MIPEYRHRALSRRSDLRWPIRLRLLLLIPGSWRWNAWVREWTARLECRTYESETTRREAQARSATPEDQTKRS